MVVLYPLNKLLIKDKRELTRDFKAAIKRIFRILDVDRDGWITDNRIIKF